MHCHRALQVARRSFLSSHVPHPRAAGPSSFSRVRALFHHDIGRHRCTEKILCRQRKSVRHLRAIDTLLGQVLVSRSSLQRIIHCSLNYSRRLKIENKVPSHMQTSCADIVSSKIAAIPSGAEMETLLPESQTSDLGTTPQSNTSTTLIPSSPQPTLSAAELEPVTPHSQGQPTPSSESEQPYTHLELTVPQDFDLEKAVVSYGFFMAAPNRWLFPPGQESGCLERPLRLADGRAVWVRIGPMKVKEPGVLPTEVGVGELGDGDKEGIEVETHPSALSCQLAIDRRECNTRSGTVRLGAYPEFCHLCRIDSTDG